MRISDLSDYGKIMLNNTKYIIKHYTFGESLHAYLKTRIV